MHRAILYYINQMIFFFQNPIYYINYKNVINQIGLLKKANQKSKTKTID